MGNQRTVQARTTVATSQKKDSTFIKPQSLHNLVQPVFQPQRAISNQAVQSLLRSVGLQAKLAVSQPGDIYEQEADRVAEHVMRKPEPQLQRACTCRGATGMSGECEKCSKKKRLGLQTKLTVNEPRDIYEQEADRIADQVMATPECTAVGSEPPLIKRFAGQPTGQIDATTASVDEALATPGRPLEPSLRQDMEQRFDYDFSRVQVHTGSAAQQSAQDVHALAYTVGHDIVFGAGQFAPGMHEGRRLIAHELTHVVQQASTTSIWRRRLSGVNGEQEEEVLAKGGATRIQQLMRAPATVGPSVTPLLEGSPGLTLQREPEDETLEETSQKITERSAEKAWSKTSPGIIAQEKPGERFLLMNFAIREAVLKKEHEEFLRNTVYFGTLTSDPMAKIVIIGHADSTGSKSFNDRLARKRAQEAEKALRQMGRHNLRIDTVTGKGANEPIAQNNSVFGRAKNRRVEILVTPWKPEKPVPELLTELQKGMKPFVVKVDNFAACPFQDTVKSVVEDAFKPISTIRFDWEGKSTSPEAFISFDDTSTFSTALGLSGDIFINSFRNNKICKSPGDDTTCEKVFPETASVMGRAIANTVAHETGHAFALDHVPATDNYMWSPELHPLNAKTNKTFDEKVVLQRTLQSVPETFNASQLVHMVNRIKEKRKKKPGVVEFE